MTLTAAGVAHAAIGHSGQATSGRRGTATSCFLLTRGTQALLGNYADRIDGDLNIKSDRAKEVKELYRPARAAAYWNG